jgi:MFS family permease
VVQEVLVSEETATTPSREGDRISPGRKAYTLGVLTAVYSLNLIDRGLIHILAEPIKRDLHLSDTQLGMVTGIAFALFYATLGLPMGRWADRGDRAKISSLAIALWGTTVMACLFVTSFPQLVVARVAAAIGEAGCKPPTYSLVGDYFPGPTERTRAMTIYWTSGPIAAVTSYVLGGWLNDQVGWRMTFFLMGIPGLVVAGLVFLTLRDPRTSVTGKIVLPPSPPIRAVASLLWRKRSARHLTIALTLLYTLSFGLSPWYAAFLIRSHGFTTGELGIRLGLIIGASGLAGILFGGFIAVRYFSENERGQMRCTAVAMATLLPCFVAFLLVPTPNGALVALFPLMMIFNFFFAPTYALLQRLVPDAMRATAMSVVLLAANLIGMGIGPQLVGILSDLFKPTMGTDSLRYAMLALSTVAIWSAWHFWQVGRTVERDLLSTEVA